MRVPRLLSGSSLSLPLSCGFDPICPDPVLLTRLLGKSSIRVCERLPYRKASCGSIPPSMLLVTELDKADRQSGK